jgi:L-asparaginase/Glu-tRNA(Gln) amidotransferase subunit D
MTAKKTSPIASLSTAYHKAALIIQAMALGPVYSGTLVSTTKATEREVCIILSQLVEMKVVKVTKGATPKYKLSDAKDALVNADLIAAGLNL